jgi:hypothetical protein
MPSRMLLCALAAAAATFAGASTAMAYPPYDPDTHETDVELPDAPSPPPQSCDHYEWRSQPKVVIHTSEFTGSATRKANMIAAIEAIDEEFNHAGGTAARVTQTQQSTDPFTIDTAYDSSTPTIHVGFVQSLANEDAVAATKRFHFTGTCDLARVNIGVLDLDHFDWRFNMPEDAGVNYWEAGARDDDGNKYFRTSYLHELLHAYGLEHSDSTYAFMNYAARPWANRAADDRVRPLPADLRLLRDWYPASGTRSELATLTTWYDENDISDSGAATGKVLCAPSRGSGFSASFFDAHCGAGGAHGGETDVSAGDMLRTRFALANYSTDDVDVDVRLWLSADDRWDIRDAISPTQPDEIHIDDATSARKGLSFEVPSVAPGTYHVIVRASGEVSDWIPLPGTVTVD